MLYGLAEQGNAPKFVMQLNKSSVPTRAIIVSSCFAGLCIIINKFMPNEAFKVLMSLVVSCLIINWIMIAFTHLKFRKNKDLSSIKTKFPSFLYPVSNYICILFLAAILFIMSITGMHVSVILIPIWLLLLYFTFKIVNNKRKLTS